MRFNHDMPELYRDSLTRRLYANDASMYEELPEAVCFPKNREHLQALLHYSADHSLSITPRSAGTSLAGQATGGGLIVDVSRYMRGVGDLDLLRRQIRVEPGVIRDDLNRKVAPFGLQFGPDTATSNRCMIGGMIGNNSSGSFSILHGSTRDHVHQIEAVLSDGSSCTFGSVSTEEFESLCRKTNLEGKIYRGMRDLIANHRQRILAAWPHPEVTRRNTGYALDRLCSMEPFQEGGRPFNVSELLCGSEGTLALTAAATLNLVPLPAFRHLVVPQFHSLRESLEAAVEIVKLEPSAVELVDRIILEATRGNLEQQRNRFFLQGEPEAILIVQFEGDDAEALSVKARQLQERLRERGLGYTAPAFYDPEQMQRVWELRKAGLGLLMGLGKESRTPTFVEDTAVRVQDLPAYVEEFRKILKRYNTRCVFYAHASVGELHFRPVIDLARPEGVEVMKRMAEEVAELVSRYRGSLSGEHGDGRARAPYIEKVIGREMMPLLHRVKEIWDPHHRLNPGKIVDPGSIDSHLRTSPTSRRVEVPTRFHWRREGGFGEALELCNGAGVCRKSADSGGVMCPSWHATNNEKDTTRGRANLFRQIFRERQAEGFGSEDVHEALKLCLSCKACKSECPANVDMAKMKSEFLHGRHQQKGTSLSDLLFGEPERFYPLASALAPMVNVMLKTPLVRALLQELAGVDTRRTFPRFVKRTFRKRFSDAGYGLNRKRESFGLMRHIGHVDRGRVALLVDPFVNHHEPEIAEAACRVLFELGYDPVLADVASTGRAQISRGLLDRAAEICSENIEILERFSDQEIPVIGLEPSELLTLRDEYPDLCSIEDLTRAKSVAANSYLWEEFTGIHFEKYPSDAQRFAGNGRKVLFHNHCHTRALTGGGMLHQVLERCGFQAADSGGGCCGMAGSFGYEEMDISMEIGSDRLFPAVRAREPGCWMAVPGFSCRHQIHEATGNKPDHPAQIMDRVLVSRTVV
ncbi:MAG: FAD-linked oxidase C-terminal domain-containing protein [Balneolaceae bacterium]